MVQNADLHLFGVDYLAQSRGFDEEVEAHLSKHDVANDQKYRYEFMKIRQQLRRFDFLRHVADMDSLIYAQFISQEIGMGVFAHKQMPKSTVVGLYSGYIRKGADDTAYAWAYPHKDRSLSLDGRHAGNLLRFVNDYPPYNCQAFTLPLNGRWQIVYITTKFIHQGEQLSISYGSHYWTKRS